jgi:hypothetical protein
MDLKLGAEPAAGQRAAAATRFFHRFDDFGRHRTLSFGGIHYLRLAACLPFKSNVNKNAILYFTNTLI